VYSMRYAFLEELGVIDSQQQLHDTEGSGLKLVHEGRRITRTMNAYSHALAESLPGPYATSLSPTSISL